MSSDDFMPLEELDVGATVRGLRSGQKVLNRYTLKKRLGGGGMGVVWLAYDETLEREIAFKFLSEMISHDRGAVADLKREAKLSLDLAHPNIVRVHDFVVDEQCCGISMEFIDGDTLSNLRADQPNRVFEAADLEVWVGQLCKALKYAHEDVKVVHRDLKPANLMIGQDRNLKIADFGISRSVSNTVARMTSSQHGVSGTLVYMSPQQVMGEPTSILDDVYSLGATLYELLTSKPPFYDGPASAIQVQVLHKVPPPMTQRRKELKPPISGKPIPRRWEETIAACLSKDPAQRPQNCDEVMQMLGFAGTKRRGREKQGSRPSEVEVGKPEKIAANPTPVGTETFSDRDTSVPPPASDYPPEVKTPGPRRGTQPPKSGTKKPGTKAERPPKSEGKKPTARTEHPAPEVKTPEPKTKIETPTSEARKSTAQAEEQARVGALAKEEENRRADAKAAAEAKAAEEAKRAAEEKARAEALAKAAERKKADAEAAAEDRAALEAKRRAERQARSKPWMVPMVVIAVLLIVVGVGYWVTHPPPPPPPPPQPETAAEKAKKEMEAIRVELATLSETIEKLNGNLSKIPVQLELATKISGDAEKETRKLQTAFTNDLNQAGALTNATTQVSRKTLKSLTNIVKSAEANSQKLAANHKSHLSHLEQLQTAKVQVARLKKELETLNQKAVPELSPEKIGAGAAGQETRNLQNALKQELATAQVALTNAEAQVTLAGLNTLSNSVNLADTGLKKLTDRNKSTSATMATAVAEARRKVFDGIKIISDARVKGAVEQLVVAKKAGGEAEIKAIQIQGELIKALAEAPNSLKNATTLATVNTVSNTVNVAEKRLVENHQANVAKVAGLLTSQLQKLTQEFAAQLEVAQEIDDDAVTKTRNVQKEMSAALTTAKAQVNAANLEALKSAEVSWKGNLESNTRLANLPGEVVIHTVPEAATVTLKGKALAGKPALFAGLRLGKHEVEIKLDGYETTNFTAVVRANSKTDKVVATNYSVALMRSLGTLKFDSKPTGATYTLTMTGPKELIAPGNKPQSGQTGNELKLPTGEYTLELNKASFKPFKTNLYVRRQPMDKLDFLLELLREELTFLRELNANALKLVWLENLPGTPKGGYVGIHEVTQEQYQFLMRTNPSAFQTPTNLQRPVESVSWEDAMKFCDALTKRERAKGTLPKGRESWVFTLPTNAQWDYYGTNTVLVDSVTSNLATQAMPKPVGSLRPNSFGLFDTRGNVWELIRNPIDLLGARGGSFKSAVEGGPVTQLNTAYEFPIGSLKSKDGTIGFRVILVPPGN